MSCAAQRGMRRRRQMLLWWRSPRCLLTASIIQTHNMCSLACLRNLLSRSRPTIPAAFPSPAFSFFFFFFSHFNVHLNRRRHESQVTSQASVPGAMSESQLTSRGECSLWWKPVVICSAGGQNASAPCGTADRLFLLSNSESKRYGALIEPCSGKTESGRSGVTAAQEKDKWRTVLGCRQLPEVVCFLRPSDDMNSLEMGLH